jgi:hypothetical protein
MRFVPIPASATAAASFIVSLAVLGTVLRALRGALVGVTMLGRTLARRFRGTLVVSGGFFSRFGGGAFPMRPGMMWFPAASYLDRSIGRYVF